MKLAHRVPALAALNDRCVFPGFSALIDRHHSYGSAALGALIWLGFLAVPPHGEVGLGTIERLFLFAPLVIVPLGLALAVKPNAVGVSQVSFRAVCCLQPFAAVLAGVSFLFPTGLTAALLASPWTLLCFLAGVCGLYDLARGRFTNAADVCFDSALVLLPVGGIGLIQSRFGATPLGFQEPLVLLVAVHFHYASFVSPLLVGATARAIESRTPEGRSILPVLLRVVAVSVIAGSPLMAMGFVFHLPWLRTVAAFLLGGGLALLSVLVFCVLPAIRPRISQFLLAASALSIVAAMWLAVIYTVGDYRGEVWISIPQMARTHGILNTFGFSLCGLLGWSLAFRQQGKQTSSGCRWRPQTLLRRWE